MGFVGWIKSMNVVRLKWVGIVTYFGVYGLLFFDIHVIVNEYLVHLPATIRPPPLEPVWVVMDLPKSVSMGVFSLAVTALVLSAVVVRSAWTTLTGGRGQHGSKGDAADEPATVGWNAGAGTSEGGRQSFDHERYNMRVTGRQNHAAGRPNYHGSWSGESDGDRSGGPYEDRFGGLYRDRSRSDRGEAERTEPERGEPDRGGPERGQPDRGGPERGQIERTEPERDQFERGQSERSEPLRAEARKMTARAVAGRTESSRGDQQADGATTEEDEAWPEEWVSGSDL